MGLIKLLTTVFLLLGSGSVLSQNLYSEGLSHYKNQEYQKGKRLLRAYIENAASDTAKKAGIKKLGDCYFKLRQYDSAVMLYHSALKVSLSDSLNGKLYGRIGQSYYEAGDYANSILYHKKKLAYYKNKKNWKQQGDAYYDMGRTYVEQGDYVKALEAHLREEAIFIEQERTDDLLWTYNSLGGVYRHTGALTKSKFYYKKALGIAEALESNFWQSILYNNLGILYKRLNNPDSSLICYKKSLSYKIKNRSSVNALASTYTNLGEMFLILGNLDSSEYYSLKALDIRDSQKAGHIVAICNNLGWLYLEQGKYDKAKKHLTRARKEADEGENKASIKDNLKLWATYYQKTGQPEQALVSYKQMMIVKDSLINIEKARALTNLSIKYETEQKERDLKMAQESAQIQKQLIERQNYIMIILVILAIVFLLLVIVYYNRYIIKQKSNEKIQLFMRELHHRMKNNFNLLASILSLQSEQVTDKRAREVIKEGSSRIKALLIMHKKLYMNNNIMDIDMKEYISQLVTSLTYTFGKGSTINARLILQVATMDVDKAVPVGLIINELVTNSLKHAFPNNRQGTLTVNFEQINGSVKLIIGDDGIGVTQDQPNGESFGLKMVHTLTRQLEGVLKVERTSGTRYEITFPYQARTKIQNI
ncbi:MAG TPA: tetratricopeptide repeat protein [Cyclobacteriaceae bacterium]